MKKYVKMVIVFLFVGTIISCTSKSGKKQELVTTDTTEITTKSVVRDTVMQIPVGRTLTIQYASGAEKANYCEGDCPIPSQVEQYDITVFADSIFQNFEKRIAVSEKVPLLRQDLQKVYLEIKHDTAFVDSDMQIMQEGCSNARKLRTKISNMQIEGNYKNLVVLCSGAYNTGEQAFYPKEIVKISTKSGEKLFPW